MDEICRVCLKNENEMAPLFNEDNDDLSAGHMISACTIYEAKPFDDMPQQICARCLAALVHAYSLKLLYEKSHRQLLEAQGKLVNLSKDIGEVKSTQTESSTLHPCERCDWKFFSFNELRQHRLKEHKGSPMVCRFCGKSFKRVAYLKTHIAMFHPDAGYTSHVQCHLCEKRFTRVAHLRRHLSIIHKQAEYAVESIGGDIEEEGGADALKESAEVELGLSTSSPVDTDTSQFEVRTHDAGFVEVLLNESNMNRVEYTAEDIVDDSLISSPTLPREQRPPDKTELVDAETPPAMEDSSNEETKDFSIDSEQCHTCHICHKNFSTNKYLQGHLAIHKRKGYECKECPVSCMTKAELMQHMKAEGHDKPLLCPECGLRCKTPNILMLHMRRHNGEKPYKCRFCSKAFPRMDDVRVHEKYHTNEKSHFCETCGKGFQRKYNLTIHRRVHTGEKPYKCSHCPQAFAQVSDLKIHIRRHTGERYACEVCGASFLHGFQLRQHKLKEHGIEEVAPIQRVTKFTSPEEQAKQIKQNLEKESNEVNVES